MLRPATAQELMATGVLSLRIDEASAKIRRGPPKDAAEDLQLEVWAGEIPLRLQALPPVADPQGKQGLAPPEHVTKFRIG